MTELDQLHAGIAGALGLSMRLHTDTSGRIREIEKFRVIFTVANSASKPTVCFRNPRLVVEETAFATPAGGSRVCLDLPDSYLRPGASTRIAVDFETRRPMSGGLDLPGGLERVVRAWATADLDQDLFFKVRSPLATSTPGLRQEFTDPVA